MRLKRQMVVARIVGINRKIDNISAKVELYTKEPADESHFGGRKAHVWRA